MYACMQVNCDCSVRLPTYIRYLHTPPNAFASATRYLGSYWIGKSLCITTQVYSKYVVAIATVEKHRLVKSRNRATRLLHSIISGQVRGILAIACRHLYIRTTCCIRRYRIPWSSKCKQIPNLHHLLIKFKAKGKSTSLKKNENENENPLL